MDNQSAIDEPYKFEFVPAPPDLTPYLNSLYVWRSDLAALTDILPAYSGQLVVVVQGRGHLDFDGKRADIPPAFILTPLLKAYPFVVEGPALVFGASLNFRGWAAITGLDVSVWHDQLIDPRAVFSASHAAEIEGLAARWRAGALDENALLAALSALVRAAVRPLKDQHRAVIDATLDWLSSSFNPELSALYDALPVSRRQAQRLVGRFFGQSPVGLIRRYRAVRAASLLAMPDIAPALEVEIRNAFYDQAHLIREVRHFTGRTPRLLQPTEDTVVSDMMMIEGYSAVDPFGGTQDEQLRRYREE